MKTISFNIVVEKIRPDLFTAHCLELDLIATSVNCEDAQAKIKKMIGRLVEFAAKNNRLSGIFRPASPEVWKKFLAAIHSLGHSEQPVHADNKNFCVQQNCYA